MNALLVLRRFTLTLLLGTLLFAPVQAANTDHVLILNSYHQGMGWTDGEIAGLMSSLEKRARPSAPVELHMEYMDAKRLADQTHFNNLRQVFAHKYKTIPLKAIVVTDNDAFDFMRRYRDELFPGVPVVFCGVNWFQDEQLKGLSGFTGVAETADSAATIRLMLHVHPDTKRIVVIIDDTTTGKALRRELEPVVSSYNGRIEFEFMDGLTPDELIGPLTNLSANELVLLMPYASDRTGRFISYPEVAGLVARYSPVPIYASWDFYLGYGIV